MSNIVGLIAVLLAIVCMYLAQVKSLARAERRNYSLLGSAASIVIAVEAAHRGAMGVCILFAAAAGFSLLGLAISYLNPDKPDA